MPPNLSSEHVPDLVVLGNATVDDLVFCDGSTRMGQPGGNAVYAAYGASLWGVHVGLCVVVGRDYPRKLLDTAGLDLRGVQEVNTPSLRNWGLYEEDDTCQYIFRGAFGPRAHEQYSPRPEAIPPSYLRARFAHLAPVPFNEALLLLDTLHEIRERGGVSVDPDARYLASLSTHGRDDLLSRMSFFLPSLREAALLFPGQTPAAVLEHVRDQYPGVHVAAVKLAADGCLVYDRRRNVIVHLPAAPARVVDTTGAGDSFCGGFLAGFALTGDGVEAALHGLISASFIVEAYGIPTLTNVRPDAAMERLAAYRATTWREVDPLARHDSVNIHGA